eukprot:3065232-Pyramimonas_sp.AAC.1
MDMLGDRIGDTEELVYVGDTLILASSVERSQTYMTAIAAAGANYGFKFNWGSLDLLSIRCWVHVFLLLPLRL